MKAWLSGVVLADASLVAALAVLFVRPGFVELGAVVVSAGLVAYDRTLRRESRAVEKLGEEVKNLREKVVRIGNKVGA